MHTTARAGWRIHFNSDLSGTATLKKDSVDLTGHGAWTPEAQLEFPAELLVEFAARALERAACGNVPSLMKREFMSEWLCRLAADIRQTGRLP